MALPARLKAFLASQRVSHEVHKHPVAYTAQEIAAAQHLSGRQLAKCVVVKTDRGCVLAVLRAVDLIDLKRLKALLNTKRLTIANERDIKSLFPDIEIGAMPVFGQLYDVPVVMDRALGESETIACNAGTHTETMSVAYRDVERLVNPKIGNFALVQAKPKSKPKKKPAARKPGMKAKKPGRKKPPRRGSLRR